MAKLTDTVKQNAENAREASGLATDATDMADTGGNVVQAMVTTIDRIHGSSNKISAITGVIEGIAFQTNILALNAAVESARAGEQGRGFAVVASEVRSLAQRSASAAKEIKNLIASSVAMIEAGSQQATDVSTTMSEINVAIKRVSEIIREIAGASEQQSRGIEQVNLAIVQMDQMTQRNAALVEQAADTAETIAARQNCGPVAPARAAPANRGRRAVYSIASTSFVAFIGQRVYRRSIQERPMTTSTPDRIELTDDQAALLASASRLMSEALDRARAARVALVEEGEHGDVTRIDVPPATLRVLSRVLAMMASQQTFLLYPADTELTTGQAADMLGVSRPYLIARLEAGDLPFRKVGRHRRIRMDDVLSYKATMQVERKAALSEMVAQSEAIGGYDL